MSASGEGPVEAPVVRVHASAPKADFMDAIWISTLTVAVAEIGDKTQLLAIVLAARFRKPLPIILGMLAATLLNHAVAASLGYLVAQYFSDRRFQILIGVGFIAMAAWALIPDKEDEASAQRTQGGVFLTTLVSFFLVEIGDKTQIATSLLAAHFHNILLVATGTTLGMMLVNIPAVLLGEAATRVVPLKYMRIAAAALFALFGLWVLWTALH